MWFYLAFALSVAYGLWAGRKARKTFRALHDAKTSLDLKVQNRTEEISRSSAILVEQQKRLLERTRQLEQVNQQLENVIQQRQRAEDELNLKKTLLESQNEASIDGILTVDPQGRILSFNHRFAEMWGIPASVPQVGSDELVIQLASEKTVEPRRFAEKLAQLHFQKYERSRDEVFLKDGRIFDRYSAPVIRSDGTYYGRIWYFRDISERKRVEYALRREKAFVQLLQSIAAAANEAPTAQDAMQMCLDLICSHTGWSVGHAYILPSDSSEDMVSARIWHFDDPERYQILRMVTEAQRFTPWSELVGKVFATRKPSWIEDVAEDSSFGRGKIAKDLGIRSAYSFPVFTGVEISAVLEFFSETALELDIELFQVMTHVGTQLGRVFEREKAETELIKAREAAVEASSAKSQFLANMSHEIRTPLNALIGMATLISNSKDSNERREYIAAIKQAGDALLTVINDILDLSKIESGKLELESYDFSLPNLVKDSAEIFAYKAREKGLQFSIIVSPDTPKHLSGDADRIRQVLTNLVSNAIKFTEQGEVSVMVWKESETDQLVRIRGEVIDTGVGIPEKALQSLFEAFSQADASTTRKYGGSGLGLCICKRLVEMMGGEIGVESKVGAGSRFWFTICLNRAETVAEVKPVQKVLPPPAKKKSARILIVEDNPMNQLVASKLLKSLGYQTSAAGSGKDALEVLSREKYDLIFMDCQMPVMDGYVTTAEIRASGFASAQAPIVAMTANALKGDREKCLKAGMDDYIAKPVDVKALEAVLEKWLPGSAAGGEVEVDSSKARKTVKTAKSERRKKASAPKKPAIIDKVALNRLRSIIENDRPEMLRELLELYLEATPKRIRAIHDAISRNDAVLVTREAHDLKSTSADMGAKELAATAFELEKLKEKGGLDGASALISRIDEQYRLVEAELRRELSMLIKEGWGEESAA